MEPVSKKFINAAADVVVEQLEGVALSDPERVSFVRGANVLIRSDIEAVKQRQVTVITGGGSGHEPAFGGYVGPGYLSAAVCGGVFASPSSSAVLTAIRTAGGAAGVLVIVMNYTGDRLNFGKAVEQAKGEGLKVAMLIVGDDCALPRDKGITGRRGIAGTILVQKVACAAAEAGMALDEASTWQCSVLAEATQAAENVGTMGVALTVCSLPGQPANARLDAATIEVGLGIHGEPGVKRQPLAPADELAAVMLEGIVGGADPYLPLKQDEQVVVMVNNLGGSTKIEEAIVSRAVLKGLAQRGACVRRVFCGHFMTALDMCGISVTVMRLEFRNFMTALDMCGISVTVTRHKEECRNVMAALDMRGISVTVMRADALTLARLDAASAVPVWHGGAKLPRAAAAAAAPQPRSAASAAAAEAPSAAQRPAVAPGPAAAVEAALRAAAAALIAAEPELTKWDSIAGDGDCGETFRRGAQALLSADASAVPRNDLAGLLRGVAAVAGGAMGGTSGAIVDIFFTAGAGAATEGWPAVVAAGLNAVSFYGGAKAGMRTLLDALQPFSDALSEQQKAGVTGVEALEVAFAAARTGAESTRGMQAQAGRANYVQGGATLEDVPDPGAMAVAIALEAVLQALQSRRKQ
ncbi:Dihydroxyacetone/glycerone kinase [Tribonema minus]|uniref:Dihydroxyacetone/glycerone kinase n=1 Tax=Tribonema minus TaxID=303371 RepID=A0A835YX91_9STRA|nr:Dihydroxyacetone/glycerone kinase [Tribonema minus]